MSAAVAETVVRAGALYVVLGLAFALAFAARGAGRIDPGAATGSLGFRILLVPGATALWPLLAWRWLTTSGAPPAQHDAHSDAARRRGTAA